jgi:hypothetical protein
VSIIDQGQDGTPFISYYDKVHCLSFVWDGSKGDWIDVSFGGAGEPVIARIPWVNVGTTSETLNLRVFARFCEEFINQIHNIESVDDQAHGRTQP